MTLALALNWVTFAVAVLMGLAAWFVYLWAVQAGQWKSVETAAERLVPLDDRESVPLEPLMPPMPPMPPMRGPTA